MMEDIIIEQRNETTEISKKKKVKKPVVKKKQGFFAYFASLFNKTAIISLLLLIDFVLFCRAGNINIFADAPWFLSCDVQYVFAGVVIVSFVLMLVSSVYRHLQNLVASLIFCGFVWIIMNQFALFDKESFLFDVVQQWWKNGNIIILKDISHWVVMIVAFLVGFWIFAGFRKRNQFYLLVILLIIMSVLMMDLYNHRKQNADFAELYADKVITVDKKGNNFVYIAMPNLPSYRYLERISPKYPAAKNTLNAMLGLYTRNGFMLYTNAYTIGDDKFKNLAQSLNLSTEGFWLNEKAQYNQNWDFKQISSRRAELTQSKFLETFAKNGYIRKVVEDRSIELCFMNGEQSANTCVRREMMPYLPDNVSGRSRAMMLLGQWLGSMDLFTSSPRLYAMLKSVGVDDVPVIGIDYSKIPALGSIDSLEVVAEDIIAGKDNRAYVVWMSMPEEGYVYDELCQLKPISDWVVAGAKTTTEDKRINAYFEQTSCLFGKLADFMRKLKEAGADQNTVVVLQGVSGLDMLSLKKIDEFEAKQMVTMAIKDPKHNKFTINKQFCSAPKILRQYLFKKEKCVEQEGLKFDDNLKKEILERIENHNVINKTSIETLNASGEWFRNWMRANYKDMVIPIEMPIVENAQEVVEENKPETDLGLIEDDVVSETIEVKEIKLHAEVPEVKEEKNLPETMLDNKVDNKVENVEINSEIADKIEKPKEIETQNLNEPSKLVENVVENVEENVEPELKTEQPKTEKTVESNVEQPKTEDVVESNVEQPKTEKAVESNVEQPKKADVEENKLSEAEMSGETQNLQDEVFELLPGEEVVVMPQGENKADKIIIRINETEEEKLAKIEAEKIAKAEKELIEAKSQAEKLAMEAVEKAEKQRAEKTAEAVEKIENALDGPSVDELGLGENKNTPKTEEK